MKYFMLLILISAPTAGAFTLIRDTDNFKGWEGEELAVEINAADCPDGLTEEIEEAFAVWNQVTTAKLKLKVGGANNESLATIANRVLDASEAHAPVIICDSNFEANIGDSDSVLGVGLANTVGGDTLNTGFIILNTEPGAGGNISNQSAVRRKVVIAHELGHMLGIGHSAEPSALMFFNIGEKTNLNLHQDDSDAYTYLYPRSEPSDGFLGCGHVQKGGDSPSSPLFWILFALPLLIWANLRRTPKRSPRPA